jgi:hypothetical protein
MGFGLVIGFIAHLKLVTTINFSTIADLHTLQLTTACSKYSQSAIVFTSHCLATYSSNVLCFCAYVIASWLQSSPCSCELHSLTNSAVHYDTDYSSQSSLALPGSGSQHWPFLCSQAELTNCHLSTVASLTPTQLTAMTRLWLSTA